MIFSIFFLGAALVLFMATFFIVLRGRYKKVSSEVVACLTLILLLGALYTGEKIVQQLVNSSLFSQLEEFGEILITIFALNLLTILAGLYYIGSRHIPSLSPRFRVGIVVLIIFSQFAFVGTFWALFYFYKQAEAVVTQQTEQRLDTAADLRGEDLVATISLIKIIVTDHANNAAVATCLAHIESGGRACTSEILSGTLESTLKQDLPLHYFTAITDAKGIIVGSTDPKYLGMDWSAQPAFSNHTTGGYFSDIGLDTDRAVAAAYVSAPIEKDGKFLGVYIEHIEATTLYALLQNKTNLGDTGETFLVNADKKLLSPRRFSDEVFIDESDDPEVVACADDFAQEVHKTSSMLHFANQSGRDTLSVHTLLSLSGVRWCVVAEMSEQEAVKPLSTQLLKATLVVAVVLVLLMTLFLFVFDYFFSLLVREDADALL
jgi:hypothetical protein